MTWWNFTISNEVLSLIHGMIITALIFILPRTLFKKRKERKREVGSNNILFFFSLGRETKKIWSFQYYFSPPPSPSFLTKASLSHLFLFPYWKKKICCFRGVWESGGIWRSKPFSDNSKFLTFHTILHCSDLVRFEKNFVFINWMQFFLLSR